MLPAFNEMSVNETDEKEFIIFDDDQVMTDNQSNLHSLSSDMKLSYTHLLSDSYSVTTVPHNTSTDPLATSSLSVPQATGSMIESNSAQHVRETTTNVVKHPPLFMSETNLAEKASTFHDPSAQSVDLTMDPIQAKRSKLEFSLNKYIF